MSNVYNSRLAEQRFPHCLAEFFNYLLNNVVWIELGVVQLCGRIVIIGGLI
ncbi:hypothetical protein SynROS8604_01443 [Synechococcus sp. ROS8604]|nr:hypothetical protein SynROS8604_01443 [Synechococcus sp. ROS8604]